VTGEIAEQLLVIRRLRAFPRLVKRKLSSVGVKRAKHRTWPHPTIPPADAIVIVGPPSQRPSAAPGGLHRPALTTRTTPNQPNQPKLSALLLACVLTRLLVRNDELAVLLDRGVAPGGAAAAAPGPARAPPAGFRRTGHHRQRGVKSAKAPPDTGGGEPARTKPPFPRQPEVGHRVAGKAQLGGRGDDGPGPAVGLLGCRTSASPTPAPVCRIPGCSTSNRRTPARPRPGPSGPGRPTTATHLDRPAGLGQPADLHPDDGPAHHRRNHGRGPPATSAQLGMQPRPRLHDHLPVLVVGGGQRGNGGRPGRRVLAGEPLSVLGRPAGGARRPLGRVGGAHPARPDADQHHRPQLGEGVAPSRPSSAATGATVAAAGSTAGRIRRASTGAVQESWSQPSWQAHW
jgi:hypothetical protein